MSQIIIINCILINLNFLSFFPSLSIAPPLLVSSFQSDFEKQRQKTEFVDDGTEKMLNSNKKWFILIILGFGWLTYKSLFAQKK